jgi:putative transcriptional regulator
LLPLAEQWQAAREASRMATTELAPGFLVAAPSLLDPNFKRSVVLLVDHRPEGSLGFVVNRPADASLSTMLERIGMQSPPARDDTSVVLVGGPMAPQTGWVVFEPTDETARADDVVQVSDRLAVSASRELLESLVKAEPANGRLLLVLGYAGWGPGQLDSELAQGAWIPVDFDERIVFETPFEERWATALRSLGIDPARLSVLTPSES